MVLGTKDDPETNERLFRWVFEAATKVGEEGQTSEWQIPGPKVKRSAKSGAISDL